ncbi:RNA-directed DNA polymerase, eukaryota [Tanacetum coccineum]
MPLFLPGGQNQVIVQFDKGDKGAYKPYARAANNSKGVGHNSYVGAVKNKIEYKQVIEEHSQPSLVLDDSCILDYDYSLDLMGKVSDFGLLTNLKMILIKEGFDNFILKYLGGFWVIIEFHTKKVLENFKSHVGVGSWFTSLEYASNTFVIDERVVWVDIEGVPMNVWTYNTFKKISAKWDDIHDEDDNKGEVDEVPEMIFDKANEVSKEGNDKEIKEEEINSEDPFKINDLLKKKPCENDKEVGNSKESLEYPHGFTRDMSPVTRKTTTDFGCGGNIYKTKGRFRRTTGPSTGGSILEVLDELIKVGQTMGYKMDGMFRKHNSTISDYFVAIQGDWIPNAKKYLIISVYAPQDISEKRMLWSYLNHMIDSWSGEIIIMGDFNEVRFKEERFGSIFNNHNASVFNSFISSGGLVEVPLGGCEFTWCHQSGSKMSKLDRFLISEGLMGFCPNISAITLDRYLSDHRPILLREACHDYGPIPFRMFHYWFEWDGFDKFIVDTWTNINISDNNAISQFMKKLRYLKEQIKILIDEKKADKEIINKRIHVMNSLQDLEKLEMLEIAQKVKINWSIEGDENSRNVSKKEIKRAVWDCGFDKSPGPDGFTFGFYRRYWDTIENDVVDAVSYFFNVGMFPKGGNASFIALIPKMQDARVVKDFRPISLIGSVYKIIAKILANRLVGVLGDLIHEVQSVFIANRQILDGPFILDELIHWCRSNNKQAMIFKVDFEKAYDSVEWITYDVPYSEFYFRKGLKQGDRAIPVLVFFNYGDLHLSFSEWGECRTCFKGNIDLFVPCMVIVGVLEKNPNCSGLLVWKSITTEVNSLRNKGVDLLKFMNKKVGNGIDTSFWEEIWRGDMNSKTKFPRVYALESTKEEYCCHLNDDVGLSLRRAPRDGVELEQFNNLNMFLAGTMLSDSNDRKIASWWEFLYVEFDSYESIAGVVSNA